MSKQVYKNLGFSIDRYPCCSLNQYDHCLAGEHGEIWPVGDGTYKAFKTFPSGNEKINYLNSKDIRKWRMRLKIPYSVEEQLIYANNPNKRHKWDL